MSGFLEGEDRNQAALFPERLDDDVVEDSPVRVIDVFIDDLVFRILASSQSLRRQAARAITRRRC